MGLFSQYQDNVNDILEDGKANATKKNKHTAQEEETEKNISKETKEITEAEAVSKEKKDPEKKKAPTSEKKSVHIKPISTERKLEIISGKGLSGRKLVRPVEISKESVFKLQFFADSNNLNYYEVANSLAQSEINYASCHELSMEFYRKNKEDIRKKIPDSTSFSVALDDEIGEKAKILAKKYGMSFNKFINFLIDTYL